MSVTNETIAFDINSLSFFTKNEPRVLFTTFISPIEKKTNNDLLYLSIVKTVISKLTSNEVSIMQFAFALSKYYIVSSSRSNIIILGHFSKETKSSMVKIFLIHIANAFDNFLNSKNILLDTIITNPNKANHDFIAKVFNVYISFPLVQHFINVTKTLFTKKTIHLDKILYEDFYLIYLPRGNIVFNWNKVTNNSNDKSVFIHLRKNELLWNELMYHSNNLRDQYIAKHKKVLDTNDYNDFFVKMEYTAAYPKLIFVIKFLPILNGMALIHVYSRYRLSTNEEDTKNRYKEIDIFYANEVNKENENIEYRYKEPKSLKDIENFFIEYFACCNDSFGWFSSVKSEFKYIDSHIMDIINKSILFDNSNKIPLVKTFNAITNNLYKEYKLMQESNEAKKESPSHNKNNSKTLVMSKSSLYSNQPAYFQCTTFHYLKELFTILSPVNNTDNANDNGNGNDGGNDKDKDNINANNEDDITICLPKHKDKSVDETLNVRLNKLFDNDLTFISQCYLDTEKAINDKSISDNRSIFDVDITIIKTNENKDDIPNNKKENKQKEINNNKSSSKLKTIKNANKPKIPSQKNITDLNELKSNNEEKIISNNNTENSNDEDNNSNNIIEHTSQIKTVYKAKE